MPTAGMFRLSDPPLNKENTMKKRFAMLAVCSLLAAPAFADQVTGPVFEVTDTKIVVEKGKEKWTIARTPGTTVVGDLKKGSKVTVYYTMSASKIEVKDEKKKDEKKK
jgi:cytochrome c1